MYVKPLQLRALRTRVNKFGDTREAPDDNAAWMKAMPLTKQKRLDFAGIESGIDLVYPPCPP